MATKTDQILSKVYERLDLHSDYDKAAKLYEIINELSNIDSEEKIGGKITGTITERIVEIILRVYAKDTYFRITDKANEWVGDFGLLGLPFNTIISVKSYSTKERALTSGSGSALCPTILYGHFLEENFVDFDKVERLLSYKIRGFTSIYMPSYTFDKLPNEAKNFRKINNNYFIRKIENFGPDISKTIVTKIFGTQKRDVVDPRKL